MCSLVKSIYSNGYLKNPFVFQRVKLTFLLSYFNLRYSHAIVKLYLFYACLNYFLTFHIIMYC